MSRPWEIGTPELFDRIGSFLGRIMTRSEYHADIHAESAALRGVRWKLERRQFFNEVGDPAWDAFKAGDWGRVMKVFEEDRERVSADVAAETARGFEMRRLRIVEDPPTAYLRWELHSHLVFAECGRPIRVLDAKHLAHLEPEGPVPEIHVLGDRVMYRVNYTEDMTPDGATRIDDPGAVREAAALIADLYNRAEPLPDYFHREIAPLGPPKYSDGPHRRS